MTGLFNALNSPLVGFLLKLFAGLAAAGFGILGIGTTTRTSTGSLNKNGKIALFGICVAGLLAIGTSVNDFASQQAAEREEIARNQRLLENVEYTEYPLRGLRSSFEVMLPNNRSTVSYEMSVRKAIDKVRSLGTKRMCSEPNLPFECSGYDGDTVFEYRVPKSSKLFPPLYSDLRQALESIYFWVGLYKLPDAPQKGMSPKYLGRFFINLTPAQPRRDSLVYNVEDDSLSFDSEDVIIPDRDVEESGIYSIVQFFPGLVAVAPNLGDEMCEERHLSAQRCRAWSESFTKGMKLSDFGITFPYPKALNFSGEWNTHCQNRFGADLFVQELPLDVDFIDGLGNITDAFGNFIGGQRPSSLHEFCASAARDP
jgi:hypothetical protein